MAPIVGFDRIFPLSYTTKQNRISSFTVVTKMVSLALLFLCPEFNLKKKKGKKREILPAIIETEENSHDQS